MTGLLNFAKGNSMLCRTIIVTSLLISLPTLADKRKARGAAKAAASIAPAPVPSAADAAAIARAADYLACVQAEARYIETASARRTQCETAATRVRDCIGRVRDRQSSNTGKGAIIGLAAAVATGGASLLYTGAGALIGHQTSDEAPGECGAVPVCDAAAIEAQLGREGVRKVACAR